MQPTWLSATTVAGVLRAGTERLAEVCPTPALDAELLLGHVLGRDRASLRARGEEEVAPADRQRFAALLEERRRHRPIAQLVGHREFWTLDLAVTPDTLTPRPETERLVELALERMPADAGGTVLDLGTGTGAIALALAAERPGWRITATDRDERTLAVARANAAGHSLAVRFVAGDWYAAVPGERFDLIVSNPPYVADDEWGLTSPEVAFEPRGALAAGPDGLDALRVIVAGATAALRPAGWLLVEHGFRQGEAVQTLFDAAGFAGIATCQDLAGLDRVTLGRLPD